MNPDQLIEPDFRPRRMLSEQPLVLEKRVREETKVEEI